jgi:hypothetical protein
MLISRFSARITAIDVSALLEFAVVERTSGTVRMTELRDRSDVQPQPSGVQGRPHLSYVQSASICRAGSR